MRGETPARRLLLRLLENQEQRETRRAEGDVEETRAKAVIPTRGPARRGSETEMPGKGPLTFAVNAGQRARAIPVGALCWVSASWASQQGGHVPGPCPVPRGHLPPSTQADEQWEVQTVCAMQQSRAAEGEGTLLHREAGVSSLVCLCFLCPARRPASFLIPLCLCADSVGSLHGWGP